jgi:hypothetical protein
MKYIIDVMQVSAIVLLIIGVGIFSLTPIFPSIMDHLWIPTVPLALGWLIIFVRKILTFTPAYRNHMQGEAISQRLDQIL